VSPDSVPAAVGLAPAVAQDGILGARVRLAWRRLARRPPAVVGTFVVLAFVIVAVAAPWLAPADPNATSWSAIRKPPNWAHPFGTDDLGRDTLSRVI
jgi:peptide/nickel transport system permease protein